jgi:hypothetical protein
VIIMKTIIRPAIIALALLGTISAASAAPQYYSDDSAVEHQSRIAQQLDFWEQFND